LKTVDDRGAALGSLNLEEFATMKEVSEALGWGRKRFIPIISAVLMLGLVWLGAKAFDISFEKYHLVAQLLMLMALTYNFVNTIFPLIQELLKKEINDGVSSVCALLLSLIFFGVTLIHSGFLLYTIFFMESNNNQIHGYDMNHISVLIITSLNIILLIGGIMIYYIDLRKGQTRLAFDVDLPFVLSVFIIFCFTLSLKNIDSSVVMQQYTIVDFQIK